MSRVEDSWEFKDFVGVSGGDEGLWLRWINWVILGLWGYLRGFL